MGFRNPITTAEVVDTGRGPSDAGVRLYQDTTIPAVPKGVAEWRTGQMDRNATVTLSGGGSGGSVWVFSGGNTEGVDAPEIDYNVEQLPAGGYIPVLRLKAGASEGGRIAPDVALDLVVPKTELPLNAAFFGAYDAAPQRPSYQKTAGGLVSVTGRVFVTSASFGAGVTIGTLPGGCRPSAGGTQPLTFGLIGWNNALWRCDVLPDGRITWNGNGPGATSAVNSYLSLDGIRFVAEQ
jgi:hypothetical protein